MADQKKLFSQFYDQYIERIYRFVFFKVNSHEIAEDLTSETFTRTWEVFQRQNIKNPSAFLYTTAKNLVIDYYRQKGRMQVISAENASIIDPAQDLEEKMKLDSDIEYIRKALIGLKEDYQNVIIWHYLENLPISEVANLLDRTEENTRVLLHRALQSLKQKISLG